MKVYLRPNGITLGEGWPTASLHGFHSIKSLVRQWTLSVMTTFVVVNAGFPGQKADSSAASQTASVFRIAIRRAWWENLGKTQKTARKKSNWHWESATGRECRRQIVSLLVSIFPRLSPSPQVTTLESHGGWG